jgi:hypothetical protein
MLRSSSAAIWRMGYCVGDEKWATVIRYVNNLIYVALQLRRYLGYVRGSKF